MEDIIRLLPDAIANQIAAGEVVQRPASIAKELLENAIDASSQSIQLIIKDSGKTLVQVIDDGMGMSETDARLAFERHATSKLRKAEDLFNIQTMGFRGEALASIAAVAQVELKTRRKEDTLGHKLVIEASEIKAQESIAGLVGTSLAVKNVFYNVPARRNFLKSNPVEMRHILDEFHRVALAHPELEFKLIHNDLEIYHLLPGKLSQRIVAIFGKNYRKQLATCQEETPLVDIMGYIGKPENAKKTRGEQFFFVNNRYIRHPYLNHAVVNAYENLISKEQYPFYVLFLEVDPVHIDINIHPTKTEIKFDDERSIYAMVQAAVRKALSVYHLAPKLDFEGIEQPPSSAKMDSAISENPLYQGSSSFKGNSTSFSSNLPSNKRSDWEKLYAHLDRKTPESDSSFGQDPEDSPEDAFRLESNINQLGNNRLFPEENNNKSTERPVFQLHQTFILSPVKSGLLLIEQMSAYERIFYDKFQKDLQNSSGGSQRLLFPVEIKLNPADYQVLLEIEGEIRNLGFVFDVIEERQLRLKGIPGNLSKENQEKILEEFIEQFKNFQSELSLGRSELVARSLARRAAQRSRKKLSSMEMNQLIDQLFASANPNYSPSGQKIFTSLSLSQLLDLLA